MPPQETAPSSTTRVHQDDKSFLLHPLVLETDELKALGEELPGQLADVLAYRGHTQSLTALRDIRFSRPHIYHSDTYAALFDQPYQFGRAALTRTVASDGASLDELKLVMHNGNRPGWLELYSGYNHQDNPCYCLQQAERLSKVSSEPYQYVDEQAMVAIMHDLVTQAGVNPRYIPPGATAESLTETLVRRSAHYRETRGATYRRDSDSDSSTVTTVIEKQVDTTKKAFNTGWLLQVKSDQPVFTGAARALTALEIGISADGTVTPKLKAAFVNTSPANSRIKHRDDLFEGTIGQLQVPMETSRKLFGAISQLLSLLVDIERID